MNIHMLRIARSLLAIMSSKDKRVCTILRKSLLRRFSHSTPIACTSKVIYLARKEERL